jgi:hypothetical protein
MPDDHALIAATVAARLAEPTVLGAADRRQLRGDQDPESLTVQFSLFLCVSA